MSIEILSNDVIDQIAAGEVVERPSHMVKELVENSLDAGATEITVEFSQGGRFVKVTDNGKGISFEDIPKAFQRFGTSKIKVTDDLWKLSSFGFRGEALASISSVGKVTLFTSQEESGQGYRITSEFGRLTNIEKSSHGRGCTFLIEDLFKNVPARLKFMKGEAAESSQIKLVLKALALANEKVEFRVVQEGKLVFYWPAVKNRKDRAETILDLEKLYEGSAVRGNVKVKAFFSDPHQVARVSKNIWFFAQNRFIQDRSLQAAVMEAYRNLLMHGEFPYVVCFVETDPSEIDVNIHPTKSQVKFLNAQNAFRAVQGAIREVLEKAPWLQKNDLDQNSTLRNSFYTDRAQSLLETSIPMNLEFQDDAFQTTQFRDKEKANNDKSNIILELTDKETKLNLASSEIHSPTSFLNREREINNHSHLSSPRTSNIQTHSLNSTMDENSFPSETRGILHSEVRDSNKSNNHEKMESKNPKPLIRHWSLLQVIGQANLTYIICQNEKSLVLIDQHAAHERIAFERLMSSWRGNKIEVQEFLFPLSIKMSEEKIEALIQHQSEFSKLGIEFEVLGPTTLGVRSAPAIIKDRILVSEIERFSNEILDWGDSSVMEKAIADICARWACHSVIRAGQSLSLGEMNKLLEEMDEYPLSSFCPHGRPVSVPMTWLELEKDFGRRI